MYIKQCPGCGRVFQSSGNVEMCETCLQNEQNELDLIVELMRAKKGVVNIEDIVRTTKIPQARAIKIIQRANLTMEFKITWPCKRCGTEIEIFSSQVCTKCARELNQVFQAEQPQKKQTETMRSSGRMHVFGVDRKRF